MKPSAALMLLRTPPAIGSDRVVAVTRTAGVLALIGSVPLLGLGAADTPEVLGPVLSTTRLMVTGAPQLPAASWLRIETTCVPSARAFTVAAGIVASRLAIGAGRLTVIGVPCRLAPTVSMKYSAAAMFEPPLAVSLPVACTATSAVPVPLVRLGVSVGDVVVGPVASPPLTSTELKAPQLPSESWPRT